MFIGAFLGSLNAQQHSPLPEKADTLSLRNICNYCTYGEGGYADRPFSKNFLCMCYGYTYNESSEFSELILKYSPEVKVLIIENPSNIIDRISWVKFSSLEQVVLFGNDSDNLPEIPQALLDLTTIKRVSISGIRMDANQWSQHQLNYPDIKFDGEVSAY
jgi:hypothetical protein